MQLEIPYMGNQCHSQLAAGGGFLLFGLSQVPCFNWLVVPACVLKET